MAKTSLLIVDDESDIRSLCTCIVNREFDFEIDQASSVATAREKLNALKPDIVLLDIHLGDGLGFDLVPDLKRANPDVKVLFVTAYNQSEERKKAVDLGAFGLLGKPFQAEQLIERLNKMQ